MNYNEQTKTPAFADFTSHRQVRAAQISKIYSETCVGVGPDGFSVGFDPTGKPTPQVGWYVIGYEDGYISFCPPEQFEAGYKPTPEFYEGDSGDETDAPEPVPTGPLKAYEELDAAEKAAIDHSRVTGSKLKEVFGRLGHAGVAEAREILAQAIAKFEDAVHRHHDA